MRLEEHRADVLSRFGEDVTIARALEPLGVSGKWCVGLGAWDARHLSNSRRLMTETG